MSHSTRKIKPEILSRQSGLDRVSRQTNQQLIRPIKKLLLVETYCILYESSARGITVLYRVLIIEYRKIPVRTP